MAAIHTYFQLMLDHGASDLHLSTGNVPILRIDGELQRTDVGTLEHEPLKEMLFEIAADNKKEHFEKTGDVDFGYEYEDKARFRVNFFNQKDGIAAVFRTIPSKVLTCEDLGLPKSFEKNKTRPDHILTIEDPIEFVHKSEMALINHREVGLHTESFASALRGALREDPDIILVGEMRDLETINLAIEAAMTGHLVFGTLHTPNAAKTIDRIIDVFPASQQNQIRSSLSDSLKGIIAQNLFPRADKSGRIAALEVLVVDSSISNLIRDGKIHQIPGMIEVGKKKGNVPLDDAIMDHLQAGRINVDDAFEKSIDKRRFLPFMERAVEPWEL